jgi:stage IV sporulation protein FB
VKASIPVRISPMFWLSAAIIGWISSWSLIGTLIWIVIIFVSILVHEYGHALMSRFFGQFPRIELMAFGGLTYPEGPRISSWKEFLVVVNGPLFSFGLYLLGSGLLKVGAVAQSGLAPAIQAFRLINLFWTIINLFPVLPLDGGQLLRIVMEVFLGVKGIKVALMTSTVIAVAGAVVALFLGWFLIGAIFFLFAFQNIQSWKMVRSVTESDENQDFHKELLQAEEALIKGKQKEAIPILEHLRVHSKKGVLFITATQYLARIKFNQGLFKETYELLVSIKEHLSDDFATLLHFVSFEIGDYKTVHDLGAECFRREPSLEVALRNAIASASLKQVNEVIGWLEASIRSGLQNIQELVEDKVFENVKRDPKFIAFIEEHKH